MEKSETGISLNDATKKIIRGHVESRYIYAVPGYREEVIVGLMELVERCIYADNHMNDFDLKGE